MPFEPSFRRYLVFLWTLVPIFLVPFIISKITGENEEKVFLRYYDLSNYIKYLTGAMTQEEYDEYEKFLKSTKVKGTLGSAVKDILDYLDSLNKTASLPFSFPSVPVSSTDVPEKALVPAIPPVVIPFEDSLFSIQGYSFHGESSKTVKKIDRYDWVGSKLVPFYKTSEYHISGWYNGYSKNFSGSLLPTLYSPMTTLSTALVKNLEYIKKCLDKDEFPFYTESFSLGHLSGSEESMYEGRLLVLGGLVSNVPPYSFSIPQAEQVKELKKRYSFLYSSPADSWVKVIPKPKESIFPKPYIPKTKRISKQAFVQKALEQFYTDHAYDTVYDGGSKLSEMASRRVLSATREYSRLYGSSLALASAGLQAGGGRQNVRENTLVSPVPYITSPNISIPLESDVPISSSRPLCPPIPSSIPFSINPVKPVTVPFPSITIPQYKPYNLPAEKYFYLVHPVTGVITPVVSTTVSHALAIPAPRIVEGKNRSAYGKAYMAYAKATHLVFGIHQEIDEIVKRFYDALPKKLTRWKGQDGKWRRREISIPNMIDSVVRDFDKVDFVSVCENTINDEFTDRFIGLFGTMAKKVSKSAGYTFPLGLDTGNYFYKKFAGRSKPLSSEHMIEELDRAFKGTTGSEKGFLASVKGFWSKQAKSVGISEMFRSLLYDRAVKDVRSERGHIVLKKGDFIVDNKQVLKSALKQTTSGILLGSDGTIFDEEMFNSNFRDRRLKVSTYGTPLTMEIVGH
ncbi:hypothetical protein KP07_00725 [Candidatus Liberibacter solanacearum]|nr:hypothetical protein [Candidatus Liberibacter solanacearum]KJZ81442.1 hypothetical protein KP07_00725 [Candidatus Liberibacter solanacearum]